MSSSHECDIPTPGNGREWSPANFFLPCVLEWSAEERRPGGKKNIDQGAQFSIPVTPGVRKTISEGLQKLNLLYCNRKKDRRKERATERKKKKERKKNREREKEGNRDRKNDRKVDREKKKERKKETETERMTER